MQRHRAGHELKNRQEVIINFRKAVRNAVSPHFVNITYIL